MEYSTSKTGKHGHAKAKYAGLDIFTGKRYEDAVPTSHNVEAPVGTCVTVAVCPGRKAHCFATTAAPSGTSTAHNAVSVTCCTVYIHAPVAWHHIMWCRIILLLVPPPPLDQLSLIANKSHPPPPGMQHD